MAESLDPLLRVPPHRGRMVDDDRAPALLLAGRWRRGAGPDRTVLDPSDGAVLAVLADADRADTDDAVAAARSAFDTGRWRHQAAATRAARLTEIADLLVRDRERLAVLEARDTGKTLAEGRIDVDDVVAVFRYYADLAPSIDRPRPVDVGRPEIVSQVVAEPAGVCALITPWNYPLLQLSWKIAPALAAGCTMVIKPSELTPLTTIAMVGICQQVLGEAGVVNLVLGDGPGVGAALVVHPGVDLVSFTGGLATGRAISRAAADTVKTVALELGGKNPNIIFADVDLELATDAALTAAFLHSGQVCSAGSRLIVAQELAPRLVAEVARRAEQIRVGPAMSDGVEVGALVSAAQRDKIEGYVASARAEGARVLAGGHRPTGPEYGEGFYYRPTVLDGCHRDMRVVREETFGPILTVETFTDEAQAIALGNDTEYGLAGAVWSADVDRAGRVAAALRHGTVWINDFHPYVPGAEWGGMGRSGTGRELGPSGLAEYQELKHVWRNTAPAPAGWFTGRAS